MSLTLKCPCCSGITTSYMEFDNGFAKNIYNCPNCGWTNKYYLNITTDSIRPINNYPYSNRIYFSPNISNITGRY